MHFLKVHVCKLVTDQTLRMSCKQELHNSDQRLLRSDQVRSSETHLAAADADLLVGSRILAVCDFNPLRTFINLNYIQRPRPSRSVNTLHLGYTNHSVNAV